MSSVDSKLKVSSEMACNLSYGFILRDMPYTCSIEILSKNSTTTARLALHEKKDAEHGAYKATEIITAERNVDDHVVSRMNGGSVSRRSRSV